MNLLRFNDASVEYNESLSVLKDEVARFLSELSGFFLSTGTAGTFNAVLKKINPSFDILSLNAEVFQVFDSYQESYSRAFEIVQKYPSSISESITGLMIEHDKVKGRYDSYLAYVSKVKAFRSKYGDSGIDITDINASLSFGFTERLFSSKKRYAFSFGQELKSKSGCETFNEFLDLMVSLRNKCNAINIDISNAKIEADKKVQAQRSYLEAKQRFESFDVGLESIKWVFRIFQEPDVISSLAIMSKERSVTVIDQFFKVRILFDLLNSVNGSLNLAQGHTGGEREQPLDFALTALERFKKIRSSRVSLGSAPSSDYKKLVSSYTSKMSYETGISLVGFLTKRLPEFSLELKVVDDFVSDQDVDLIDAVGGGEFSDFDAAMHRVRKSSALAEG